MNESSKSKKILLIEDDASLLYGLEAKFRVAGFATVTDQGENKAEIMEKIRQMKPDYIILDVVLPKICGFETLRGIKTDPLTAKIPLFVFTDLSQADARERSKKLGADFFLLKTDYDLDRFVAAFKQIIANAAKLTAGN